MPVKVEYSFIISILVYSTVQWQNAEGNLAVTFDQTLQQMWDVCFFKVYKSMLTCL